VSIEVAVAVIAIAIAVSKLMQLHYGDESE
jgi:hypothetical protein